MTKRFIVTGVPGAGKTAAAELHQRLGHEVVAEAATSGIDVPPASLADRAASILSEAQRD